MYAERRVVTWPQPSSTSQMPRVVRNFLSGGKGAAPKGTIFIIHAKTGRMIAHIARNKGEQEVLMLTGTQFLVARSVGAGVKELLAYSLRYFSFVVMKN